MFDKLAAMGHEQVMFCRDPAANYRSIIAIHSTALGPAVGGTRLWNYSSDEEALIDALRLSRGMSYKTAMAGLPFGGGKSVILGDNNRTDRERLFRAHGRFIESLGGRYIAGEDVGTSPADLEYARQETRHVAGLVGRSGDPSPNTARGVFRAIQASARHRWGRDDIEGKTVAVQGCGNVGYNLLRELRRAGANLIVTDIDPARVGRAVAEFSATAVESEAIHKVEADIFAPCALGGIINDETIPHLKAEIIAGAANNQLLEDRHGDALKEMGILYAPDYVANAGGVIGGSVELLDWSREEARERIDAIYDTMLGIFLKAESENISTSAAADRAAEERMQK
ncbi:MAG TPA: Glu/Leu/Phe/Val dehydrogenase [Blastocatellia bacterium]|jgi:leucine dehydrogenase